MQRVYACTTKRDYQSANANWLDGAKDRQGGWKKRNKDVDLSNAKADAADIGAIETF